MAASPRYNLHIGNVTIPVWSDDHLDELVSAMELEWETENEYETTYSTRNGSTIRLSDNAEAFWGVE